MKNNYYKIMFLVFLLFTTVIFIFISLEIPVNEENIEIIDYKAHITIDDDGDMLVRETWGIDYIEDYRVRFRDIEYGKFPDNYPLPYNVNNRAALNTVDGNYNITLYKNGIDVTSSIRTGYSFNDDFDERYDPVACPSTASLQCESFFFDTQNNVGLSGYVEIEYEYIIENVITEYSDISELNWILFEYAESNINKGEVIITLPTSITNSFDYTLFTPHIRDSTIKEDNGTLIIEFKNMHQKDKLAFRLLVPTSTFSSIETNNIFINADMNEQAIINFENDLAKENQMLKYISIAVFASAIVFSSLSLLLVKHIKKRYFEHINALGTDKQFVTPPTEHSPALVGYLLRDMVLLPEDISATLLDLIYRNYLTVDDSRAFDNPSYTIDELIEAEKYRLKMKNKDSKTSSEENYRLENAIDTFEENFDIDICLNKEKNRSDLEEHEEHLIDWYINNVGDGEKVSLKDFKDLEESALRSSEFIGERNKFEKIVKKSSQKIDYYDENNSIYRKKAQKFLILPIIGLIFVITVSFITNMVLVLQSVPFIASIFYISLEVANSKKRSIKGEKFFNEWNSYKENLKNTSVVNSTQISDVEFWDYNLIYATVFGFAEYIIDKLETKLTSEDLEGQNSRYTNRNYNYYRHSFFQRNLSKFHETNQYRAQAKVTSSSKGTTSGGGFSGGGSFGGGGGGGRSR